MAKYGAVPNSEWAGYGYQEQSRKSTSQMRQALDKLWGKNGPFALLKSGGESGVVLVRGIRPGGVGGLIVAVLSLGLGPCFHSMPALILGDEREQSVASFAGISSWLFLLRDWARESRTFVPSYRRYELMNRCWRGYTWSTKGTTMMIPMTVPQEFSVLLHNIIRVDQYHFLNCVESCSGFGVHT